MNPATTVTGVLADGWAIAAGAGLNAVCSKETINGVEWQKIVVTGAPTTAWNEILPIDPTAFSVVVSRALDITALDDPGEPAGTTGARCGDERSSRQHLVRTGPLCLIVMDDKGDGSHEATDDQHGGHAGEAACPRPRRDAEPTDDDRDDEDEQHPARSRERRPSRGDGRDGPRPTAPWEAARPPPGPAARSRGWRAATPR